MKKPSAKKTKSIAKKNKKLDSVDKKIADHKKRISGNKKGASGALAKATHKRKTKKDAKSKAKAERLAKMPKSRIKRFFYRLHPKRIFAYWFSKRGVVMALKVTGISFACMVVLILGVFAYVRRELPDPKDISSRLLNQSTKFYDRTGEHLLYEVYGEENRTVVDFSEISDNAKWATVAVEDRAFYEHGGVSFRGIFRAALGNLTSGDATGQGGSTITQQFIKNSLLSTEQTYTRKVKEIILAIELERLYSKDEILGFYLNEISYGPQEYGIQAAAKSFFDKDAVDLNIEESAILAALPQAPTYFSPYGENAEDLLDRKDIIIELMVTQGYISREDADKAKAADVLATITPIDERSLYANIYAPHFVTEVQQQLEQLFGATLVQTGGLRVITTLDYELQAIAEKAITDADGGDGFCDRNGLCGDNAAFVATEVATGHVTAMVGSRDFEHPGYGSYNAALADRQPGSSFKPFDYAQLFYNTRWGPDSVIYDTPTTFGGYAPENFDFQYRNKIKVRQALGESRNIPAVKAASIAGIDEVTNLAIAMGNKSLANAEYFDLSYSLGAGEVKLAEHTHAYATFARGGKLVQQTYIKSVENADGEKLLEWEQEEGEQVLDAQVAYLMTDALTDDAARSATFGYSNANLVVPGINHAVKTGTTDNSVDGWMMGFTKHMSFGVWVGNADNSPMGAALTSHQTGPIFTQFIKDAYDLKPELDKQAPIFDTVPDGIKTVALDSDTGYAAGDKTKNKYNALFPSWFVPEFSEKLAKYEVDAISGLKPTDCTPDRAIEERQGGGLWPEVLPGDYRFASWSKSAGYGSSGGGPTEDDDVHKCSDTKPKVTVSATHLSGGLYRLKAYVTSGSHKLSILDFKINGSTVSSVSVNSTGAHTYLHTFSSNGNYKVTAEVVDVVLYDDEASTNVNVNAANSDDFEITSHSNGDVGVPTGSSFSWEMHSGADTYNFCYKKAAEATFVCLDNNLSTSYSPGLDSGATYNIKIQSEFTSIVVEETPIITINTL